MAIKLKGSFSLKELWSHYNDKFLYRKGGDIRSIQPPQTKVAFAFK